MARFIWKGPSTAFELWPVPPAGKDAEPIFSGHVAPGELINADLPAEHPQVVGWLAFGLIEPAPIEEEPVQGSETVGRKAARKD